jgi:hypothetical protein
MDCIQNCLVFVMYQIENLIESFYETEYRFEKIRDLSLYLSIEKDQKEEINLENDFEIV